MEGFVLRLIDYGESDQIARLFLKREGVVSAVAKGIKRSRRRFPHHLQPFRIYVFKLSKKPTSELYWIISADQAEVFEGIMGDIQKIALGNLVLEMVLKGVKEGHPHPELYNFILTLFRKLELSEDVIPLWFYSEIHIMRLLGFSPNFETCILCKKSLQGNDDNLFNVSRGGIVCSRCHATGGYAGITISSEALSILQFLKKSKLQAVSRLRIKENARTLIESLLTAFITYHLERPIKSISFIKEVID